MDEGEVVRMLRCLTKEIGSPPSRLPVLSVFPHWLHDELGGGSLAGLGNRAGVVEPNSLAVIFVERWFIVEGVDVTRSALHEQENDPFRPGAVMGAFAREQIRRPNRVGAQTGQRQATETAGCLLERSSSRNGLIEWAHMIVFQ